MSKGDNQNTIEIISPGRINIIGEHLDYNGGDVLPMPINLATQIHLTKTDGVESVSYTHLTLPTKRIV